MTALALARRRRPRRAHVGLRGHAVAPRGKPRLAIERAVPIAAVEARGAVMTGLSRDGRFLVENGKITPAVGSVRITDAFLAMLARADAMTTARAALSSSWTEGGVLVVPEIRFRGVRFTSGSR